MLITGDDILIEYVERLIHSLRSTPEHMLKDGWCDSMNRFIQHYVWHTKDNQKGLYAARLEGRLSEMQDRRKRLIKYLYKKEGKMDEFDQGYIDSVSKKTQIIKKFSSA